jgi:cephalosporin-C deacetylase-like acetyl esterase
VDKREALRAIFEIDEHPLRLRQREADGQDDHITERLIFETAAGEALKGILTRPPSATPSPAILYLHAHGARYDIGASELLDGRPALQEPLGPVFARMGFAALAIDMPGFGSRADRPESDLAKARLWRGKSLAGQMLGEQASALAWLAAQPFVDASRLGCFGISMGATFGYWLAAVDERVTALAHLCCFADFATLIELGAHDLHGIYLTIPGLLNIAGNGEIAGLVAPRPQLICIGDLDRLTPPPAVDRALAQTREAYGRAGASDRLILHPRGDG